MTWCWYSNRRRSTHPYEAGAATHEGWSPPLFAIWAVAQRGVARWGRGKRYAENMSSHTTSSRHFSQAPDRANRSVKSIGSRGSILSIGSVNSFCSIGSVNSAFSIGSVFSLGSIGSVFSAGAIASCLGFLGMLSVFSGLSVLSVGSYRSVLKVNRRPGTRRSGPSHS